jgi:multisubunit Na+/H+ antiporter MnhB subunit
VRKIAVTLALVISLVFLVAAAFLLHPFGQPPSEMDDYIIENAQSETGTNNAVTSVVFDYRGYDTLGEATILFAAVTGVLTMLRVKKRELKK